jgi:ubiquinone biosynthesis protein UbiJ
MIINLAIKAIAKQFKLEKVLDYVENDNVLDRKVKKLEKRLKKLEKDSLKFHVGGDLK